MNLTSEQIETLAAPVVEALRSIPDAYEQRDAAGIPMRGGDVYRAALNGRFSALALSCARKALAYTASRTVLDSIGAAQFAA